MMLTALVFEDELFSQEIARRALHRSGISNITFATDGATGLKILDGTAPAPKLIICDIFIPGKDGIEIVNALAERKFSGGLILVTGADMQYLLIAKTIAISRGLHLLGCISKPLSDDALAIALSQLTNHSGLDLSCAKVNIQKE